MEAVEQHAEQQIDKKKLKNDKSRFLKNRSKVNVDNDYHPSHNPDSVANIPECQNGPPEEDRDLQVGHPITKPISDEEMNRLQQELVHLPFENVLRLLSMCNDDVEATIEMGKNLVVPDLVPKFVKDFIVANIAVERNVNPTRGSAYKEFYFSKMFEKVADSKSLVDFYYQEKNKINGNWRLDRPEPPMTQKQLAELDEKMKKANISIIVRDPTVTAKQSRTQKARATRRTRQTKKEEPIEGSQEKEVDSDSVSVSSGEDKEKTQTEAEYVPVLGKGATSLPDASVLGIPKAGRKKWQRKTTAEKQVGPRRSYPSRTRRPASFYE